MNNKSTSAKPSVNALRAKHDREYVASIIHRKVERAVRFSRHIPEREKDDVCQVVLIGLMKEWDAGRPLEWLLQCVGNRVFLRGTDAYRATDMKGNIGLEQPLSGDNDKPLSTLDIAAHPGSAVERQVIARAKIAELAPEFARLEAHLDGADPRLRLIHSMTSRGSRSKEISEALRVELGLSVSPAAVDADVTRRLRKPFPKLAFLWEKRSA